MPSSAEETEARIERTRKWVTAYGVIVLLASFVIVLARAWAAITILPFLVILLERIRRADEYDRAQQEIGTRAAHKVLVPAGERRG